VLIDEKLQTFKDENMLWHQLPSVSVNSEKTKETNRIRIAEQI
jgi:hypothetical protein